MPPQPTRPTAVSKAAAAVHSKVFDPWNSSSSGHQRPDNTPGTGWRESRNKKLNSQFQAGNCGGARLSDTWGAGSVDWDEREKVIIPKSIKERKGRTVKDLLFKTTKPDASSRQTARVENPATEQSREETLMQQRKNEDDQREAQKNSRRIFDGVVAYVNGSTFPLISDHKLKQIITENGGQMSLHLGRRRVTHVILGRPLGPGVGAGGGLAGTKLDREIKKLGGSPVKFVGADWVLESLKAGKRLAEARFTSMKIAPSGQSSVYTLYSKHPVNDATECRADGS